ncbi:MAG: hypothetical protein AUH06_11630 [Gemmatimonadetes bacterium 13_2_20CM_69_27]|nr:MAG: hypothetical protein AUH06_11630 [Gemmatimonadetes bacterium 13_2_20CM_69_27]OLB59086.1 MAG: hypothetical protein AUI13_05425 [Gemmatimonadetes bacterium 13_2_20CM_2_69_23]PYO32419.1 MAG: hypothetical protein DMD32_05275 [Gemmatimonadota bacterium]PYP27634.1 MAG: hypothetical protein DMD51_02245 [Gemmatimonadota bacterium]
MTKRRKIAVSVSAEALAAAERLRKHTGESRSAVFERALHGLVAAAGLAQQTRRYVEGYRRRPERRAEVRTALATALTALAGAPWDETR